MSRVSEAVAGELDPARVPRHVAIVMDGNGRWAKERYLPRVEGHRNGAKTVRMVVEESRRLGIRYLTLFTFSTENWNRPIGEVETLMRYLASYLESELELLLKNDIRLRAIGQVEKLPENVRKALASAETGTAHCVSMDLILALSYGGRSEIVDAVRKLAGRVAKGELQPEDIEESTLAGCLYAPDVPDPELMIRTSNELRISNFLLWELAYSEIVISPVYWPAFSKDEYQRCLREFAGRKRRFGMTDEQTGAE